MAHRAPFGSRTEGVDGRMLDSASEARVHRHLLDLKNEGTLSGVLLHPRVAGMNGDFLVQFGHEGPPGKLNEILLVEYDGMGVWRPRSLEPKLARHAELEILGFHCRWLFEDTYSAARAVLFDYQAPRTVTKRLVCSCGSEHATLVVFVSPADEARVGSDEEIEQSSPCPACAAGA